MWELQVFPGVTLDDVADAVLIPAPTAAMAGGSPGVFSEIESAFSWAKTSNFDAAASFLSGQVSEATRRAGEAVVGIFSILGWWAYKFTDGFLGSETVAWRSRFPHPNVVVGSSPWYYIHKLFAMVEFALEEAFSASVTWLRNVLESSGGVIGGWVSDLGGLIKSWGSAYATWVWNQISNPALQIGQWVSDLGGLVQSWGSAYANWVVNTITSGAGVIAGWVSDIGNLIQSWGSAYANWLWDQIQAAIGGIGNLAGVVADAVPGAIISGAQDIAGFFGDAVQAVLLGPVDELFDTINAKLAIPGKLLRAEYGSLDELIDDMMDPPDEILKGFTGVLMLPFIVAGLVVNMIYGLSAPLIEPVLQEQRRNVGAELPAPAAIQEAWNRRVLSDAAATDMLRRHGFGSEALTAMQELRFKLPSVTDLVRFAVREVFTPSIRSQFGLDAEYPGGDFQDLMDRQGIGEFGPEYWAAHWDLPSATMGFEMLHRGVIDMATLNTLLRTQDVMPFWRSKLVEIAYLPPGRIDLRRLYAAGIFDEARVFRGYKDLGYNVADAQALADFAVEWAAAEDESGADSLRELTASNIRLAYRRGVLQRDDALDRLVEIGYTEASGDVLLAVDDVTLAINPGADGDIDPRELTRGLILDAYSEGIWDRNRTLIELQAQGYLPASADLLVDLEDAKTARRFTQAQVNAVRSRFVTMQIGVFAAQEQLGAIGITGARRDLMIAEWNVDRVSGTRQLSLAEIRKARAADRLTDAQALERVLRLGYNPNDASLLLALS